MNPLPLALRFSCRPHNRSQTQSPATRPGDSKMNRLLVKAEPKVDRACSASRPVAARTDAKQVRLRA